MSVRYWGVPKRAPKGPGGFRGRLCRRRTTTCDPPSAGVEQSWNLSAQEGFAGEDGLPQMALYQGSEVLQA